MAHPQPANSITNTMKFLFFAHLHDNLISLLSFFSSSILRMSLSVSISLTLSSSNGFALIGLHKNKALGRLSLRRESQSSLQVYNNV